jgi:UDP-N-acetylmuramoyl-tripeptide--D-alanyl-D-alanine ligase
MAGNIQELYHLYQDSKGVCTDTRKIVKDGLFISLKGPNFNANEFAAEALEKGAKYAIVDEEKYATSSSTYLVEDGLTALQGLAKFHRSRLGIPIVGITGSNGKTTTKELISGVLSKKYRTYFTQGNLNNHIGVPLTMLSIDQSVEIAVIEMGANHVGEIAGLCEIARPTHGLITNIGRAHIEGFGGIEGIIRGKSELYQFLREHDGTVFINSQDEILGNMAKRFEAPVLYPGKDDFLHIEYCGTDPFLSFIGESKREITTQMIGAYNFYNVAAALCVGKYFEVPEHLAESAIVEYVPENNRSQVIKKESNMIILDAYNANPTSMKAALESLISLKEPNKVAILGDMLELGDESDSAHQEIVELVVENQLQLYAVGQHMAQAVDRISCPALIFKDWEELASYLNNHPIHHSTILIKASRSIGLENILDSV